MKPSSTKDGPLKRGDRILDKYEVRGLLGKGGHAFVYDCFNAFLAEEVAIKLIPNLEHRGNQLFKRARGEAQVLYRLNHPNVVRVMDGGEFNGMAYIVMEKLDGTSLRQMLRASGRLPVVEALLIALQVSEALEAAHAMNVIHRDLKPDNIFLLAQNHVKVLDFGIAKFLEGGYQTTQKDLIQGTAPYMSPEHAQGMGVTFASDIFQLGTVMYEMIAGICPCMIGIREVTLQELVAIQISKLPPRLKSRVPDLPDYVDRLVWRAIAKQAQQRFATMAELTDAIRAALERLGVDLPREGFQRSAAVRKSSSRPPAGADSDVVVRTTPIALAAPRIARNVASPSAPDAESSGKAAAAQSKVQQSAAAQSTRSIMIRAAVIGAVAAVPVGVALGLAKRQPLAPRAAAAQSASNLVAARPSQPIPDSTARTPERETSSQSTGPIVALQSSVPATPLRQAPGSKVKAPRAAAVQVNQSPEPDLSLQPASGLDEPKPRPNGTTVMRSASPATVHSAPKSIF